MADYELVLNPEEEDEKRFKVPRKGIVIGRSPESDAVLTSSLVSRRHARVWLEGDALFVNDLDSRNGIAVNGTRTQQGALEEGDALTVGDCVFVVYKDRSDSHQSSVISYEKANSIYEEMVQEGGSGRLPILYKAAQLLGTVFDLDELFEQILKTIFEALPAKRGLVVTVDSESSKPEVRASLSRGEDADELPLSKTLFYYVLSRKNAILTLDAQEDERFEGAQSIVGHAIRSAMCAPLCGRRSIVGAIYVDSGKSTAPFSNADLELLAAIGRVVGIGVENARLYQENVEQERLAAIGEATAGLGHCMKNILTGIKGGAQFIDKAVEDNDMSWLKKGWSILSRSTERMEMLVLNMLTYSRGITPERCPTDLNGLVQEVLSVVSSRAESFEVKIEFRPGNVGIVNIDAREMYRVILNLVTNAIEACEKEKGEVTIATFGDANGCRIKVRDAGGGIPPEVMDKLFQAFITTKGSGGTGLGLAVSRKIVREHGGELTVDTEVGKGTTFSVELPSEAALAEISQTLPHGDSERETQSGK